MNISVPQFLHNWPELLRHPRLPDVSAALLGVASLYGAAQLSWQVIGLALPADQAAPVTTLAMANSGRSTANQLAGLSLFGGTQQQAAPYGSTSMMDAPDTQLNIKLLGIIASTNPNIARAIIAPAGGQEAYYAIGATLPGGAIIRAIFDDRVILEYNGRYEALRMPREFLAVITPGPKKTQKPATASGSQIKVQLSATEIQQLKNKLISDPGSFQGKFNYRRVMENGRIKGIRVYPGSDAPLFNKLGLKAGDMVTTINGQPVSDNNALTGLYSQLGTMPELTVEIERQGQKKIIKLPLNR